MSAEYYLVDLNSRYDQQQVFTFLHEDSEKMIQEMIEQQQIVRLDQIRLRVRDQNIDPQYKKKTENDKLFILSCLKNHFIFYNLSEKELENVQEHMFWAEMQQGTVIFRQGTIGTCFYIIQQGAVEIKVEEEATKVLKSNEGFGQLALLYQIERPSSAIAKERCGFWIIDRVSFREAVEEIVISQFEANQKFLQGMAFYQFLKPQQKEKVASSFVTLRYYKGQNIIEEGDPGSSFYIIKQGTAALLQGNLEQRKIYKGQSFGQNSLYYNTMRKMTVRAEDDVVCQVLGRQTLAKIIGPDFRQIMFKNYVKSIVQKNRILFNLVKKDQQKFFESMRIQYKKTNEVVFKKGSTVQKLIVVMEGKLKKFRSANYLAQANQTWGQSFLNEGGSARLQDDIVVQTQSVIIELNLVNLREIQMTNHFSFNLSQRKRKEKFEIDISDFKFQYYLDKGAQSSLIMLSYNDKIAIGKLFRKTQVEKNSMTQIVKQEMQVSDMVTHPFLPKVYHIYQDKTVFLKISEYIHGESLYDAIRQIGLLSTLDTQFYAACMILLLEYFMAEEIVVRDLKPDNFIINQKGYPKLVSLGSSKCIASQHKTNTVIGTPHYMAPEIVLGKEYNELVDLWSVGVMLFEFMVGELPFGGNTQNPYQIYESIIQGDVQFPRNFRDRRAKKLIQTLLNMNPQARYNGSYSNLKSNPWFQNINWDDIANCQMRAPYQPSRIRQLKPVSNTVPLQKFLDEL